MCNIPIIMRQKAEVSRLINGLHSLAFQDKTPVELQYCEMNGIRQ